MFQYYYDSEREAWVTTLDGHEIKYPATYLITYYTCGDALVNRRVKADTLERAIEILRADPQEPLGQLKSVRVEEEK
jgi:hypothetical protein